MNILLTSVGRRTYMVNYFKRALNGNGKVFVSNSIYTYTMSQADECVLTPVIYDESYIDFIVRYCINNKISAVISLFDIDLPVLAKNKTIFEMNNIQLIISDYEATKICNDKWLTCEFLQKLGINIPKSFIGIKDAIDAVRSQEIQFPLYIKPRWGMGSIGVYKVDTEDELVVLYSKLQKEIFNTYLKYESSVDKDSCIIIQESIKGQECGIEILNDLKGEYVSMFAKQKVAMRSGETDVAETISIIPFETIAKTISSNLRHIAMLDVDCFVTENGVIYVLEMNCRFGGQYPFSHNAGVNVPLQIIKWLSGEKTEKKLVTQQDGVRSCKDIMPVRY